ncbi:AraC family transcriptional regulator [Tissierella praeacuta]|uniref:helix-turn-helix domain-containing protein n=1 Tax=Tissierella praeacuta TaxID=43131 RepID=UPI003342D317
MALNLGMEKSYVGNTISYHFPSELGEGWIMDVHAADGLFVSSSWFTPYKTVSYTMEVEKPCMWIYCVDEGDITISQKGKSKKKLTSINHVIVNPQKPFTITFAADIHVCYTCVLVFDDFIQKFLNNRIIYKPFSINDAKKWTELQYNTPDITLVLEQIKWGVRKADTPTFNFECKMGELLTLILRNGYNEWYYNHNRRYHVTWENEQKIHNVKTSIDINILNPPLIEELAITAEMSISKLHRCFKQIYGMTIFEYIRIEKMKKAMLMLACDELSIKNIATQCGYESSSKFTAAFKDVHKITPSQFRKSFYL